MFVSFLVRIVAVKRNLLLGLLVTVLVACGLNLGTSGDKELVFVPSNHTEALINYVSQSFKFGQHAGLVFESTTTDATAVANTSAGAERTETSQNNEQEQGVNEGDRQINDGNYLYALSVNEGLNPSPQLLTWQLSQATAKQNTPTQSLSIPDYHQQLFKHERTLLSLNQTSGWDIWLDTFYLDRPQQGYVSMQWYQQGATGVVSKGDYWRIEGSLVRSLKVGNQHISVIKYTPVINHLPHVFANNVREINANYQYLLDNLTLGDLSPDWSINGQSQGELADASQCQLLADAKPEDYRATLIYIVTTDISKPTQKPQVSCGLGKIETVYASTNALYLSGSDYDYGTSGERFFSTTTNRALWIPPQYRTHIHRFTINEQGTEYQASATVDGLIPGDARQKAFRFSERDTDHLAVISYVGDAQNTASSRVKLTLLKFDDIAKSATTLATLPNSKFPNPIGKPGELLYATRFTDTYAYLVTFDKTDPLYAISLADLSDPRIVSELEITGFSDYLHPLTDSRYLVGIGHEAIPAQTFQPASGGFSWFLGVKLSLFKQDGTNLTEASKLAIGKRGTTTPVLATHHAFTFLPSTSTRPFRFAVPVSVHTTERTPQFISDGRPAYYDWTQSEVQVYTVMDEQIQPLTQVTLAQRSATGGRYQYSPNLYNTRTVMSPERIWVLYQNQLISQTVSVTPVTP